MTVEGVLETSLYAGDLQAAEAFYTRVLGLKLHSRQEGRHVFFRCGGGMFLIFDPRATRIQEPGLGVPVHGADGAGHVAFRICEDDLDGWRQRFQEHGVRIEQQICWPGGGQSLYVRDPGGNSIELASARIWKLD